MDYFKSMKALYENKSYLTSKKEDIEVLWQGSHIGLNNLKKLLKISDGIKLSTAQLKKLDKTCKTCIEAKHRRTIFANNRVRAKRSLQIVHTDVCGPINPDTWDGNRCFITFLDDYSLYNSVSYEIQE